MSYKKLYRLIVLILAVSLDQLIKIIIKLNFMDCDRVLIWEFLRFKPVKNIALSWINSSLNLGIGFIPHILINILGVFIIYYIYKFYISKSRETLLSFILYSLILAGAVCSLIDKVFWGGSLDYIMYTGILGGYTFDLKDVYISSFEVALAAILIYTLIRHKGSLGSLDSIKIRDMIDFILNDIRKQ